MLVGWYFFSAEMPLVAVSDSFVSLGALEAFGLPGNFDLFKFDVWRGPVLLALIHVSFGDAERVLQHFNGLLREI